MFFNLLPNKSRIGIDLKPQNKNIIDYDYLQYKLPDKRLIVIGNPPFGHRGTMALNFINHSHSAEYVCFILPMFFDSVGKGSIKYRVKGFNLIYCEKLDDCSFYTPNVNKSVSVKCVFQIWSKNHKLENMEFNWYNFKDKNPYKNILDVYTVSLAKNRECGKKWIFDEKADFYLSSTFFKQNNVVKNFSEVKYKSGIAIVFTAKEREIRKKLSDILENTDWTKY